MLSVIGDDCYRLPIIAGQHTDHGCTPPVEIYRDVVKFFNNSVTLRLAGNGYLFNKFNYAPIYTSHLLKMELFLSKFYLSMKSLICDGKDKRIY